MCLIKKAHLKNCLYLQHLGSTDANQLCNGPLISSGLFQMNSLLFGGNVYKGAFIVLDSLCGLLTLGYLVKVGPTVI